MLLCIPVMLQLSPIKTLGESIFSKLCIYMNNNDDKSNVNVPEAYQSTPTVGGLP